MAEERARERGRELAGDECILHRGRFAADQRFEQEQTFRSELKKLS